MVWPLLVGCTDGLSNIRELYVSSVRKIVDCYRWMEVQVMVLGPLRIGFEHHIIALVVTRYLKRVIHAGFNLGQVLLVYAIFFFKQALFYEYSF